VRIQPLAPTQTSQPSKETEKEENIEKDIEHTLAERDERKRRKVVCRDGRERFREKALERFDKRCVVTGCAVHYFLPQ